MTIKGPVEISFFSLLNSILLLNQRVAMKTFEFLFVYDMKRVLKKNLSEQS